MYRMSSKAARRRRFRRRLRKAAGCCLIAALILAVLIAVVRSRSGVSPMMSKKLEREGCPQSLIELMERNPEAREFVLDYEKHKDKDEKIDLSGDVKKGEIPLFLQWDERWGYKTYGDDFLAITGCGPTCLSMVRCGLGGDTKWNPYRVARMAEKNGFYVEGTGSSWELMSLGAKKTGLTVVDVTFSAAAMTEKLKNGCPIICSMGPGDFTTSGHFIVLTGVDGDGKIIVHDPNSKKNSEQTWDVETLMGQIRNLWGYQM